MHTMTSTSIRGYVMDRYRITTAATGRYKQVYTTQCPWRRCDDGDVNVVNDDLDRYDCRVWPVGQDVASCPHCGHLYDDIVVCHYNDTAPTYIDQRIVLYKNDAGKIRIRRVYDVIRRRRCIVVDNDVDYDVVECVDVSKGGM